MAEPRPGEISGPLDQARQKIKRLGADTRYADIFFRAASLEEAETRILGSESTAVVQGLMYVYQAMCKEDPNIIKKAEDKLLPLVKELKLPDTFVEELLTKMGDSPLPTFEFRYDARSGYPHEVKRDDRLRLWRAAMQFMFEEIKQYLEP